VSEQADKAFQEMLEISTDIDKAVLFSGSDVVASNLSEGLRAAVVKKAKELSAAGAKRAVSMEAGPLTQMVIESSGGTVFLVQDAQNSDVGVLATGKSGSRIGLVFYDMRTLLRDAGVSGSAEEAAEVEE
jgi:predicted regulator of Ras-like GTPase activity (Roadblock/LC7/MglB family)